MDIRVLGPVELHTQGRHVDLGPRQQRFVLAVLALEANRLMPVERLVALMWPAGAPRTAVHAVQVCVSRLRTVLAAVPDGDGARIDTRGEGYLLQVDPAHVDAARFETLLKDARTTGDDERKVAVLTEALDLWSGPALSNAAPASTRARLCSGLDEARLAAVEDRIDAQLRLGRHRMVLPELVGMVQAHPGRERPLAQLMLALYRAGQAGDALAVYHRARVRRAEELGLDPSAGLRHIELAILRNDPLLDLRGDPAPGGRDDPAPVLQHDAGPDVRGRPVPELPAGVATGGGGRGDRTPPRQLPADPRGFAGRRGELAALDHLRPAIDPSRAGAGIAVLSGTGGVGKTALAVHWAHRVAGEFPDGQLYVNLRGFDEAGPPLDPTEAIRELLDALGVPAERIPPGLAAQAGLYRSLLAGRRFLVVLDNARDAGQVRPLLPGTPGCLTVVTSRDQLTSLVAAEGAHSITLDLLSTGDARALLTGRLGAGRVAREPDAVDDIIARCARLPLALAIAAARAATRPAFSLAALAGELSEATDGLDALHGGDAATDVRAVFSWSYRTLSAAAMRLFRLLGLHPGPDISTPAAAGLAGVPPGRVRLLLDELARAHLLTEHVPGRYAFHDLLRAYAAERAHLDEDDAERAAATHRVLDHYLHTAHRSALLLDVQLDPIISRPPGGAGPADAGAALAWFTAEHGVLVAAVQAAGRAGCDPHAWRLAWTLTVYLLRRGHWHDQTRVQRAGLAAARRLGDRLGQAHMLHQLALGQARSGRFRDAGPRLRTALVLFGEAGGPADQARVHSSLAWLAERRGRPADALRHTMLAFDLFQTAGHRAGQAGSLNDIGWSHSLLGDHRQALGYCERALTMLEELGHRDGVAGALHSLGYIHGRLGEHRLAVDCYQRSIEICRDLADRFNEADTLANLGDTHLAGGDPAAARQVWLDALEILDDLGHPDADDVRARLNAADDAVPHLSR